MPASLSNSTARLCEAIRYALARFIDDGRIEIDSNVVERSIRPIALNPKNALFAGSDGGAAHWAVLASLIEPASSIRSIPRHTLPTSSPTSSRAIRCLDELLPWAYVL
jgi:transposase